MVCDAIEALELPDDSFDVSTEFLPLDQDHSSVFGRDDEDTPQKQHISSAHQDQGPIDVSELGSWAYTLSSTSSVDDTSVDEGFGQTQASAEHEAGGSEPGQPARLQNVISTASETSASGLRERRNIPAALSAANPQPSEERPKQAQTPDHRRAAVGSAQTTAWVEASRYAAVASRLDELQQELCASVNDRHVLEVRAAQAEDAAVQVQRQLKAQAMDVKAAAELVQSHTAEMTGMLAANESSQQRVIQLETDNAGLHAKLCRAEDALVQMRSKFRQLAEVSRQQTAAVSQNVSPIEEEMPRFWPPGIMIDDLGQPINFRPSIASRPPPRRSALHSPEPATGSYDAWRAPAHPSPQDAQELPGHGQGMQVSMDSAIRKARPRPRPLQDSIPQPPQHTPIRQSFPSSQAAMPASNDGWLTPEGSSNTVSLEARPYATEASLQAHIAQWQKLEARLMELNAEKAALTAEAAKRGATTGRTLAEKRRSAFVDARLDVLTKELGAVRQQLKQQGMR